MKRILNLLLLLILCVPSFGQQVTESGQFSSEDYERCMKFKKAGIAGIAVFGTTWLAGEVICSIKQNTYANDRWDGNDIEEYVALSKEAKSQKEYKIGQAISIAGFLGTGASIAITAIFGSKAKNIRNANGDVLATVGMGMGPGGMSLNLTF